MVNEQQQIQVKFTDEVLKGAYANQALINHTGNEFVIDFMNIFPPNGIVTSRVILSPVHMKSLITALQDNLAKYESQFGKVTPEESQQHQFGFKTE